MTETPETADLIGARKIRERATPLATLDEAFQRYRTPFANQQLIRRIVENTDAADLVGYGSYFRVNRRGGGPALEVHVGYTTGFRSEEDAIRRAGDVERWPSRRLHGAWGVTHPENRARTQTRTAPRRPARPSAPEKPEPICMTCFMVLPSTGICATCDA